MPPTKGKLGRGKRRFLSTDQDCGWNCHNVGYRRGAHRFSPDSLTLLGTPTPGIPISERQQLALIREMTNKEAGMGSCAMQMSNYGNMKAPQVTTRRAMKVNEKGETRLHIAARANKIFDIVTLISEGANVNARDYAGWTPLHEACSRGSLGAARHLLYAGAAINITGPDNETPLHDAARSGDIQLVSLLLRYGANPLLYNNQQQQPIDNAANSEVARLLATYHTPDVKPRMPYTVKRPRSADLPLPSAESLGAGNQADTPVAEGVGSGDVQTGCPKRRYLASASSTSCCASTTASGLGTANNRSEIMMVNVEDSFSDGDMSDKNSTSPPEEFGTSLCALMSKAEASPLLIMDKLGQLEANKTQTVDRIGMLSRAAAVVDQCNSLPTSGPMPGIGSKTTTKYCLPCLVCLQADGVAIPQSNALAFEQPAVGRNAVSTLTCNSPAFSVTNTLRHDRDVNVAMLTPIAAAGSLSQPSKLQPVATPNNSGITAISTANRTLGFRERANLFSFYAKQSTMSDVGLQSRCPTSILGNFYPQSFQVSSVMAIPKPNALGSVHTADGIGYKNAPTYRQPTTNSPATVAAASNSQYVTPAAAETFAVAISPVITDAFPVVDNTIRPETGKSSPKKPLSCRLVALKTPSTSVLLPTIFSAPSITLGETTTTAAHTAVKHSSSGHQARSIWDQWLNEDHRRIFLTSVPDTGAVLQQPCLTLGPFASLTVTNPLEIPGCNWAVWADKPAVVVTTATVDSQPIARETFATAATASSADTTLNVTDYCATIPDLNALFEEIVCSETPELPESKVESVEVNRTTCIVSSCVTTPLTSVAPSLDANNNNGFCIDGPLDTGLRVPPLKLTLIKNSGGGPANSIWSTKGATEPPFHSDWKATGCKAGLRNAEVIADDVFSSASESTSSHAGCWSDATDATSYYRPDLGHQQFGCHGIADMTPEPPLSDLDQPSLSDLSKTSILTDITVDVVTDTDVDRQIQTVRDDVSRLISTVRHFPRSSSVHRNQLEKRPRGRPRTSSLSDVDRSRANASRSSSVDLSRIIGSGRHPSPTFPVGKLTTTTDRKCLGTNSDCMSTDVFCRGDADLDLTSLHPKGIPTGPSFVLQSAHAKKVDKAIENFSTELPEIRVPASLGKYLLVTHDYDLHDIDTADKEPSSNLKSDEVAAPEGLASPLKELYVSQERERHRLKLQHVQQLNRLQLTMELEILRECKHCAMVSTGTREMLSYCAALRSQTAPELASTLPATPQEDNNNNVQLPAALKKLYDKFAQIMSNEVSRWRHESCCLRTSQLYEWEMKRYEIGLDGGGDNSRNFVPAVEVHDPSSSIEFKFFGRPIAASPIHHVGTDIW